ncbi:MAG: hypothetical protein JSS68_00845 [Actinobacteria bacterium]|nr:hypothetical protein [Actinomycetota bacterium]
MYRTGPLLAAAAVALALASCGGEGSSGAGTVAGAGAKPTEAKIVGGGGARGGGAKGGEASGCQDRLGEFVGRMNDLRHSLLAGLSYSEYVVRVRAVRDAYEAVPVQRLGVGCLKGPAADAEAAFNQYLRAANAWGECAGTEGCAASEIEGKLQHRWRIASKSLDAAERG